jgi:hypothetical protein
MPLPTPRDELLGRLLQCYQAIKGFLAIDPSSALAPGIANKALDALLGVNRSGLVLDDEDHGQARAAGYGLPSWLITDERPYGLQAALDLLTTARGQLILDIVRDGRPGFQYDDLELLELTTERLLKVHRERLLPARLGDPAHSFVDLAQWLLADPVQLALAAASSTTVGSLSKRLEQRLAEPDAFGAIERELATRLLRVDVPVVYAQDQVAVVLGLEVSLAKSKDGQPHCVPDDSALPGARPVDGSFVAGVANGHLAALQLLEEIGADPGRVSRAQLLTFSVRGAPGDDLPLTDSSAGLPVALHVLASVLELESLAVATTGRLSDDGVLEDMGDLTRLKAAAVQEDGFRSTLAARAPALREVDYLLQIEGTDLAAAAEQFWGSAWTQALRATAVGQLRDANCRAELLEPHDHDEKAFTIGQVVIDVPTKQRQAVLNSLREHPDLPIILGGPAGSGKSWTLRSVTTELAPSGWKTLAVRFFRGALPEPKEAERLVGHALRATGLTPDLHSGSVLVALEDLEAYQDSNADLDVVLVNLAKEFKHPVVAATVAVQGAESSFKWNAANVVPLMMQKEEVVDVARQLISTFEAQYGAARGLEGIVAAVSGGDMWWLVRLLHFASQRGRIFTTPERLREEYLRERTEGFDEEAMRNARSLAAASFIGLPLPQAMVPALDHAKLIGLGACRVPPEASDQWILPSPEASRSLVKSYRPNGNLILGLHLALGPVLNELLELKDMGPVLRLLARVGGEFDGKVRNSLLQEYRHTLVTRLCHHATPPQLSHSLLSLGPGLDDTARSVLAVQLVDRLVHRGWTDLSVAEVTTCLRALRANEHLLPDADEEATGGVMDEVFFELEDALPHVLARPSPPEHVLGLLRQLREWRRRDTSELLRFGCAHVLDDGNVGNSEDMQTLLDLLQFARSVDQLQRSKGSELEHEVLRSDGAQNLLGFEPQPDDDALTYLAYLAVRKAYGRPSPAWGQLEPQLQSRLARTSVHRAGQSLSLIRKHAPVLHQAVRRCQLDAVIYRLTSRAAPLAAANLINTMLRVQPRFAKNLLLEPDGTPRSELLEIFVDRVLRSGDQRAASLLVRACAAVDEEFGRGAKGFSYLLARRLQPMLRGLEREGRTSVVVYVARALLEAQFDEVELDELTGAFVRAVERGFTGATRREHAPQLALILAEEEALGPGFLERLRVVKDSDILSRMQRAESPGALAHYHRFAVAVRPELCRKYAPASGRRIVAGLRDSRTPTILQALAAVSRTLGYAGEPSPGPELLRQIEPHADGWGGRLFGIRNPMELAQSIDILAALDPNLARDAVECFHGRKHRPDNAERSLAGRILGETTEAERGLALLSSVARANPELGQAVLGRLRSMALWADRLAALLNLEHPSTQGQALRQLGQLGIRLSDQEAQEVLQNWLDLVPLLRSPRSISDLLLGLLVTHPESAQRLMWQLDVDGLARRVARSRPGDIPAFGSLLSALALADRTTVANELAESMARSSLRQIDIEGANRLLGVVLEVAPDAARGLASQFEGLLAKALARSLVVEPNGHLLATGWLARRLALAGLSTPDAEPATTSSISYHRVARLWSLAWLAPTVARKEELHRLLDEAAPGPPPRRPWAAAAMLTVAGRLGRAGDVLGEEPDTWNHVLTARGEWIRELLRVGPSDPPLQAWLTARLAEVRQVADRERARGGIFGAKLDAITTTAGQPDKRPPLRPSATPTVAGQHTTQ